MGVGGGAAFGTLALLHPKWPLPAGNTSTRTVVFWHCGAAPGCALSCGWLALPKSFLYLFAVQHTLGPLIHGLAERNCHLLVMPILQWYTVWQ